MTLWAIGIPPVRNHTLAYRYDALGWMFDKGFGEAATVFVIDGAEEFEDFGHSDDEERIIVVGLSREMRILTVVHCLRENDTIIRIISARKTTHLEEKLWKR